MSELFVGLTDDLAIWLMLSGRFQADVFVGLFLHESNEGLDIGARTSLMLGSRGLRLSLDIYDHMRPGGQAK